MVAIASGGAILGKTPQNFPGLSHYPGRGLAVNFRKKCGEMRWKKIIFTAYFLHLFAVNAVNRGELFIFTTFSIFLQNVSSPQGFEPQTSCMPAAAYSTAPTVTYYLGISREFKSDWVNVGKQMRWFFVRSAVKCAELFFFTASSGEKQ